MEQGKWQSNKEIDLIEDSVVKSKYTNLCDTVQLQRQQDIDSALMKKYNLKSVKVVLRRLNDHVLKEIHMRNERGMPGIKLYSCSAANNVEKISDPDLSDIQEVRAGLLKCLKTWFKNRNFDTQQNGDVTRLSVNLQHADTTSRTSRISPRQNHHNIVRSNFHAAKECLKPRRKNRIQMVPISKGIMRSAVSSTLQSPHACPFCSKDYMTPGPLNNHIAQKHAHSVRNDTGFTCVLCKVHFSSKIALNEHETQHNILYLCSQCDSKFSCRASLRLHEQKHINWFHCPHCILSFHTNLKLRDHLNDVHADTFMHKKTTWFTTLPVK